DQDYAQFNAWLANKEYDYTTEVEEMINELEETAKKEKSYDNIKSQIEALRSNFAHNKKEDLKEFEEEIKGLLRQEIVSRYYLQDGLMQASFDQDENIKAALDVLNSPEKYAAFLAGNK